jgi:hypothetical protein
MYKQNIEQFMDLSAERRKVASALIALEAGIGRLVDKLAHSTATVFLESSADSRSSIQRACGAYAAINYEMEDEVGTSVVCLGVIGANSEILRRAQSVNGLKSAFKELCAPLHGVRIRVPVRGEAAPTKSISAMRVILRNIQRSDLNLLAAYRKIPILEAPPASITYTRANTRAVYRKTIDEVYSLLSADGAVAAQDRARLSTLPRSVTNLALVKERYQNVRANVLFSRLDARGRGRIQIAAELPVMYSKGRQAEPTLKFLSIDYTSDTPKRQRRPEIEDTPFLQSLPVFRYKD